jgi:phage-related holin
MFSILFKFTGGTYGFGDVLVGGLLAAFFWAFGDLGLSVGVILALTVADFGTGIMRAAAAGQVESRKIMRTVHKIVGYSIFIIALNIVFIRFLPSIPSIDKTGGGNCFFPEIVLHTFTIVPYLCAAFIIIREMTSIVENLAAAGILPPGMEKFLARWFKAIQEALEKGKA